MYQLDCDCPTGRISRLALYIALGLVAAGSAGISEAYADTVVYSGDALQLKTDPTGDMKASSTYSSLYVTDSDSSTNSNSITVKPAGDAVLNAEGRAEWDASAAPFNIYGGVDIKPIRDKMGGTSIDGADITANTVTVENISVDWSGTTAPAGDNLQTDDVTYGYSGGLGGFGGGSVFGGLSVGDNNAKTGGNGGQISENNVTVTNASFIGGTGGEGGYGSDIGNDEGSIGLGGFGGGSVYGGLSIGGDGLLAGTLAQGGAGGSVFNNEVTLINVALTGAQGGYVPAGAYSPRGHSGLSGGSVFGGLSVGGSATYGWAYITLDTKGGGGIGGDVYANKVVLDGVVLNGADVDNDGTSIRGLGGGSVYGGLSMGGEGFLLGAGGTGGFVYDNVVVLNNTTLKGGSVNTYGLGGGSVYGGLSLGGSWYPNIAPALAEPSENGGRGGNVYSNHVTLTDVTLKGASGGDNERLPGGSVYGGLSMGANAGDGGDVTGNTVAVSGSSSIWDSVYGGYSIGGSNSTGVGSIGAGDVAINNTVTLKGSGITIGHEDGQGVMQYGSVWGGRSVNGDGSENTAFGKVISGNTLNLVGYRGTVSGIYNFENYNWTLPADVVNGDTLVTIAEGGTAVDLTDTKHTVADMQVSDNRLQGGDTVTFITKTQGSLAAQSYTVKQGQFIVYDVTLSQQSQGDDTALVLTINDKDDNTPNDNSGSAAKLNPQSKSYAEGRAASLAFVSQGNDLIATAGIDKIRVMVRANEEKARRPALIPFVIANGSSQRYKTGSHVDIDSFNFAAGLAGGGEFGAGHKATAGVFFEYGRGNYDTYNSFSHFDPVRGGGDADYKGGGIFGRIDFAGTGLGRVNTLAPDRADGFYAEASLRAGRARNNFSVGRNADVYGNFGGAYRGAYDSTSTYFGGHLAGGYVFNFDSKQSLDMYGRYLWAHLSSDTVTVANEKLHFEGSASSRLQIGGRYAYAYGERFKPYIGAAYEYEFDGDIKARAYEFDLDRPSLKGSTGIFEVGFSWQPVAANRDFSVQVNAQGYVGRRQGGGGGVKVQYQF